MNACLDLYSRCPCSWTRHITLRNFDSRSQTLRPGNIAGGCMVVVFVVFFEWLSLHVFSNICSEIVSIFLFRSANKLLFFVFLWLDKVSKMNDYSGCKICRNELSATEINLFTRAQNVDAKTIYFGISLGFDSWFTLPPNHGANSRCRPLLSLYPR